MLNYLRTRLKLSFDRSFSGSWIRQILWLAAASVVSYFIIVLLNDLFWHRVLDARTIALLLIDPGNASNDTQTPYFPAIFLIAVFGVFIFSGMLVSVISNILERRVENFRKGEIHYQFHDHVLVLGFDTMVTHSVHRLCMDKRYKGCDIIVQSSQDIEYVREEILTGLSASEFRRIVFIHARISSAEELRKTHAHRAREVFIFGERTCEEHDSVNIAAVTAIARICEEKKRKTRLACHVMLNHQTSYAIFQLADLDPTVKAHINFRPFNLNEIWSQRVLAGKAGYTPLDRNGIGEDSGQAVHLVIIGMTAMGISMAVSAAQLAHYPNFGKKGIRTRITFIDKNARKEMNFFKARYTHLFNLSRSTFFSLAKPDDLTAQRSTKVPCSGHDFLDIEWEFIEATVESPYVRQQLINWAGDKKQYLTLAVCFNTAPHSVAAGLYLPAEIYEKQIPVYIHQRVSDSILQIAARSHKYQNVRAFGMISSGYEPGENISAFAAGVNYLYAYYFEQGRNTLPNLRPTAAQLEEAWERISTVKQWSNIYNANSFAVKMRSIGKNPDALPVPLVLTDEEVSLLAEVEHNRWNVERLLLGSRPFKDEKEKAEYEQGDAETRTKMKEKDFIHPDITPYSLLNAYSKNIDWQITKGMEKISYLYQ